MRDVFSKPAYQCPELLLLALAAVPSDAGGNLRVEMLSRLLPLYFRPNRDTHAAALIRRLWQVNPRLVVQSGVKAFNVDSTLPSVVYVSENRGLARAGVLGIIVSSEALGRRKAMDWCCLFMSAGHNLGSKASLFYNKQWSVAYFDAHEVCR